ncbi:MAG: hypothetical protein AAGF07_05310 [Patescibacteria group bacterium]
MPPISETLSIISLLCKIIEEYRKGLKVKLVTDPLNNESGYISREGKIYKKSDNSISGYGSNIDRSQNYPVIQFILENISDKTIAIPFLYLHVTDIEYIKKPFIEILCDVRDNYTQDHQNKFHDYKIKLFNKGFFPTGDIKIKTRHDELVNDYLEFKTIGPINLDKDENLEIVLLDKSSIRKSSPKRACFKDVWLDFYQDGTLIGSHNIQPFYYNSRLGYYAEIFGTGDMSIYQRDYGYFTIDFDEINNNLLKQNRHADYYLISFDINLKLVAGEVARVKFMLKPTLPVKFKTKFQFGDKSNLAGKLKEYFMKIEFSNSFTDLPLGSKAIEGRLITEEPYQKVN